jgi:hypothetical protein
MIEMKRAAGRHGWSWHGEAGLPSGSSFYATSPRSSSSARLDGEALTSRGGRESLIESDDPQ